MRKTWVIVGIIAIVAIGGIVTWMVLGAPKQSNTSSSANTTDTAASGDTIEPTDVVRDEVTVTMKNSQFSPQNITVKRGTTVKWVNEDTVRHNVVAANEDDLSGLPASNPLFGKGGTYEFTFETVGTYEYKCTPHPFMTGTVEVTE